jgi:polysaccharide pyruvyl transferase WcaK-like protein
MYKLAIMDTNALANKGSYARLVGILVALKETLPENEVTVFHRYYDLATQENIEELKKKHPNVRIKRHPWYNEKRSMVSTTLAYMFWFPVQAIKQVVTHKGRSLFGEYDVIIDLNLIEPEQFNDKKTDIIDFFGQLFALLSIWNCSLNENKVMVCSATIGPYNNPVLVSLAKSVLNKVSLITLREAFSGEYIKSIGIEKPKICITADLAFLMELQDNIDYEDILESLNIIKDTNFIIGICPAAMMSLKMSEDEYIQLFSELSDFIIRETDATILYIANTFQDISLVEKIFDSVNNPLKTRIVPFNASASDIKSVIGICNLFICSRFHALVGATSIGIPSIGLVSYSPNKFHGIIGKMMGQDQFLLDIHQAFEYNELLKELEEKTKYLIENEKSVRSALLENVIFVKDQALLNGRLVNDLISGSQLSRWR